MDPAVIAKAGVGFVVGVVGAAACNKMVSEAEFEPGDSRPNDSADNHLSKKEVVGIGCFGAAFCATL